MGREAGINEHPSGRTFSGKRFLSDDAKKIVSSENVPQKTFDVVAFVELLVKPVSTSIYVNGLNDSRGLKRKTRMNPAIKPVYAPVHPRNRPYKSA
jgi:hypothetical protein